MTNYDDIKRQLAEMKPRSRLYELVKHEMKNRGRWKRKPRGKGFKRGYDSNRK